jgi:hypothetical protein
MKLLQFARLSVAVIGSATLMQAGAQTPQQEVVTSVRSAEPYMPPALRKPLPDGSSGPILLRYQAMQKLKNRFDAADLDGNGTLSRDEARKAGLTVVDKNFDHIDTAQRGAVSFDDLKAFLIQRREEAHSR